MEEVTIVQQTDGAGQDHYVLKNMRDGAYIRLDARGYFLWQLMDGTRTVRDLIVEYTIEFRRLRHESILRLFNQLRQTGFLNDSHHDVYAQLNLRTSSRSYSSALDLSKIDITEKNPNNRRPGHAIGLGLSPIRLAIFQ